ncbi:hypothetical protein JCM24511_06142 [Saitozyma sp. JCM 24511]|nr:hypothetical protein JCM24511_06142 [Saitozyma sp. JCM 24511]
MRSSDWKQATPYLWFCVLVFAMGDLMYGIDSSSFGSLQALPSFLSTFGEKQPNGTYVLSTNRKSIMNSVVYVGRLVGVLVFEPLAERFGYRAILFGISVFQVLAVVLELTAKSWIQFTVGRVFAYMAVGLIENTIPTYSAEVSPLALRGFFAGLITPINTASSVWGAGMSQAYATETGKIGWLVPVAVQIIPAVISIILVFFTVESPRWLVSKGKKEQALVNLKRLRTKEDVAAGLPEAEIEALENAIEFDRQVNTGSWIDMVRGAYWRRSLYVALMFFFYQVTGNSFYNAYGPSFFVSQGLGSKSFTYAILVQLMGMIGSIMAIVATDRVGRRPLCIFGAGLLIVWDFLIGYLGSKPTKTVAEQNTIIASFIMLLWSTKVSWATHSFLMGAEMGGIRMRKKIIMIGTSQDVIWSFVVSYCTPYIMNDIGAKVGYIFGGVSVVSFVFAILFLPELAGRGLEEVDELFDKPRFRWGWQYEGVKTSGVGAAIAELERGHEYEAQNAADVELSGSGQADPSLGRKEDVQQVEVA